MSLSVILASILNIIINVDTVFVLQGSLFDYSARESPRQREAASQVHQDNEG